MSARWRVSAASLRFRRSQLYRRRIRLLQRGCGVYQVPVASRLVRRCVDCAVSLLFEQMPTFLRQCPARWHGLSVRTPQMEASKLTARATTSGPTTPRVGPSNPPNSTTENAKSSARSGTPLSPSRGIDRVRGGLSRAHLISVSIRTLEGGSRGRTFGGERAGLIRTKSGST